MRKKTGFKFTPSVSTYDGKDLAPKLQRLLRAYASEMRQHEPTDTIDLSAFMLYCSYVSRNADELGLVDFDLSFSIDEVRNRLGNAYVAANFVDYYAGLCAQGGKLPDLRGINLHTRNLSKAIATWAELFSASGLSLTDDHDYGTASAIRLVLTEAYASDSWGRYGGNSATMLSVAELVTRLSDVEGKTVLDFACGNGVYLASALAKGAASVCGRDINIQAVMRARIGCFFANPMTRHDIAVADALTAASATSPAQRVFVAPALGMRLREFDIRERDYCMSMVSPLIGEEAMRMLDFEDFCVAKALASLADDGIAVLHVSAGFLFRLQKTRQALRSALVKGGYLQTVIEMPGGVIPGTAVKSALLIIGKQPAEKDVLIVDLDSGDLASKNYVSKSRGRCEITETGIDWLAKTVERREEIPLVSTIADRERILASGSNLCYSTYGDVFDYGTILEETRSTKDIMDDIKAAQASIDSLSEQIADILNSIEKKG